MSEFYSFQVKDAKGELISLEQYKGKVVVIVNVASKCGFTPQYKELQDLYDTYKNQGLEILGFPCNQFKEQEPGSIDEIQSFCSLTYGVEFPIMDKVDVNGENESPLYTYLKEEQKGMLGSSIKWNFTKFLVDKEGTVVKRYAPNINPLKMKKDIEKYLA